MSSQSMRKLYYEFYRFHHLEFVMSNLSIQILVSVTPLGCWSSAPHYYCVYLYMLCRLMH